MMSFFALMAFLSAAICLILAFKIPTLKEELTNYTKQKKEHEAKVKAMEMCMSIPGNDGGVYSSIDQAMEDINSEAEAYMEVMNETPSVSNNAMTYGTFAIVGGFSEFIAGAYMLKLSIPLFAAWLTVVLLDIIYQLTLEKRLPAAKPYTIVCVNLMLIPMYAYEFYIA